MQYPSDFPDEPRGLGLAERRAWALALQQEDRAWRTRLLALAEPPPGEGFPAFLLATPPFRALAQAIGGAQRRGELRTSVADQLDHFVVAYRDYLRTRDGEDAFAPPAPVRATAARGR